MTQYRGWLKKSTEMESLACLQEVCHLPLLGYEIDYAYFGMQRDRPFNMLLILAHNAYGNWQYRSVAYEKERPRSLDWCPLEKKQLWASVRDILPYAECASVRTLLQATFSRRGWNDRAATALQVRNDIDDMLEDILQEVSENPRRTKLFSIPMAPSDSLRKGSSICPVEERKDHGSSTNCFRFANTAVPPTSPFLRVVGDSDSDGLP